MHPIAARLLDELERAQAALVAQTDADECVRAGLAAVRAAFEAGLRCADEQQLLRSPAPDEWCMAEVVEHVVEHDRRRLELEQRGPGHYVTHGLEHALQLWTLRDEAAAG